MGGGAHGLPLHRRLHDAAAGGGVDTPPRSALRTSVVCDESCMYVYACEWTVIPLLSEPPPHVSNQRYRSEHSWLASSRGGTCGSRGRRGRGSSRSTCSTRTGASTRGTGSGSRPRPSSTRLGWGWYHARLAPLHAFIAGSNGWHTKRPASHAHTHVRMHTCSSSACTAPWPSGRRPTRYALRCLCPVTKSTNH